MINYFFNKNKRVLFKFVSSCKIFINLFKNCIKVPTITGLS